MTNCQRQTKIGDKYCITTSLWSKLTIRKGTNGRLQISVIFFMDNNIENTIYHRLNQYHGMKISLLNDFKLSILLNVQSNKKSAMTVTITNYARSVKTVLC